MLQCLSLATVPAFVGRSQVVNSLLPALTFKGYTGESVKSRALAWAEAGEPTLSSEIIARRRALFINLSALDNGIFAAQQNNKKKMLSDAELQNALSGSIEALDSLIEKMGCETRVVAGVCEILSKSRGAS